MQIPKLSAPLVKDVRTGEGIFEWLTAALISVSAYTGDLSFARGGTYLTILAGIKGLRRCLLKLVAAQVAVGIGAPITPALPPVLAEIPTLGVAQAPLESSVKAGPQIPGSEA